MYTKKCAFIERGLESATYFVNGFETVLQSEVVGTSSHGGISKREVGGRFGGE